MASLKTRLKRPTVATALRLRSAGAALVLLMSLPLAQALPAFNRQTGQNCVACHAGGQFPELTPYGRLFKLTGYTIGDRAAVPVSAMGVLSAARVADTAKSDNPGGDFARNKDLIFPTGSVFLAGKLAENLGVFAQATYDKYALQNDNGQFVGHSAADNIDVRYADRLISAQRDLIFGISVNNNPSVSDPWNSAPAWFQYAPGASVGSHQFIDGAFPGYASRGNLAGVNGYGYLDKSYYGELGLYGTARGALSFMSAGIASVDKTPLRGINPYWRLAYTREWGASNVMVGASGMNARIYDTGTDVADPGNLGHARNLGFDAQYQYLLDPHTATVQFGFMRQTQRHSPNTMAAAASPFFLADGITPVAAPQDSDRSDTLRLKVSYVYQARYGGSFAVFNVQGTSNTLNQTSGYDSNGQITSGDPNQTGIVSTRVSGNLRGNPGMRGFNQEFFWTPVQYLRAGIQYTAYSRYNGAASNYDGFGRNARDNNTTRLYVWAAY